MRWTKDQQKVIDLRNRNILVSAAAGSGKTAVLVERIITMITEGEHPVDIDRLLIVTFTNAAAAEMRERIGNAIEKKLEEMPENEHLQKQMTLIHSAQITTIHSFCLNVIRNHFHTIDLDPSFRVADEAELTLLKSDVMEELLERKYEEAGEEFLVFTESYASGKSDEAIEQLILSLYGFSMSYPWPEEWLESRRALFRIDSREDMEQSVWMQSLLVYIGTIVEDMMGYNAQALSVCHETCGPYPYVDALEQDRELLIQLQRAATYQEYGQLLSSVTWARLSAKRDPDILDEKKDEVKALRETIKDTVKDLSKQYFFQSEEEMLADIMGVETNMNVLIDLTREFAREYAKKKAEKNLVDFNDLEHFALNILATRAEESEGESKVRPTTIAEDLSEYYEEILIDEYQDSNLVQETIMTCISRERKGTPNLFMVGDVKQSIYKFRLARPELFMEKYNAYPTTDSLKQRVNLAMNFRSRRIVLESINYIFEQIMGKGLGGIDYDAEAALYVGADYEEELEGIATESELLLVDAEGGLEEIESEDGEGRGKREDEQEELTQKEMEARAIAKRIRELTDPDTGLLILDKENSKESPVYKRATGKDIVILLRTMSGWSDVFVDTLMAEGIMAYSDTQSGYFGALEIQTVLNLLRIIDNPRQDIPLVAVLHSPMVGLASEELAKIRARFKDADMYEATLSYGEVYEGEEETADKVMQFLGRLEQYRDRVPYTPIHELIEHILEDTGYYHYVATMPAGERRVANIDMLIQKAISFESTSYMGLFHFIRYIEKLHKYEIDYGEASVSGGNDDSVRIMSIHKSKGLEFPIVFVAGLGKNFNNQDARTKIVIHPDLGLGPDYIDHILRIKSPTLIKKVLQKKLVLENLGEELRVLYVALTRAKEKLILTGTVKSLKDKLGKWNDIRNQESLPLTFQKLSGAGTFLDWVVPSILRNKAMDPILSEYGLVPAFDNPLHESDIPWSVQTVSLAQLSFSEVARQVEKRTYKEELLSWDANVVHDKTIRDRIEETLSFVYPYENAVKIPVKMTVSELKKLGQKEEMEESEELIRMPQEKETVVPAFISKATPIKGTDRGTLYHKVLECIDYTAAFTKEDVKREIQRMVEKKILRADDAGQVSIDKIGRFLESDVANRMRTAIANGALHREQQFVLGIPASSVNVDIQSEEPILIQGIIDVYFEEEGEVVLLDYKTDFIPEGAGEELLINRYRVQLEYYQKAIERLTGRRVKETLIYSFGLGKEILVN